MKSIKGLAVVAFAAMALAVPAAAPASEGGFTAEKYPALLNGTPGGGGFSLSFPDSGLFIKCAGPTFEGAVSGPSHSLSTDAEGSSCGSGGGEWLEMNGCGFEFHPGSATFDIGPSGCGPIQAPSAGICGGITIQPKSGLSATYENTGSGSKAGVRIQANAENLKYTVKNAGCGTPGTYESLDISGEWDVKGFVSEGGIPGKQIGVSALAGAVPDGLFMNGGGFDAQAFPVDVTGEATAGGQVNLLEILNKTKVVASCDVAQLNGGELSAPGQTAIALAGAFDKCNLAPFGEATVKMNTCSYSLSGIVTGTPYEATGNAISCSKAGDKIEILGPGCTVTVKAQTLGGKRPTLGNVGTGASAAVDLDLTAGSVQYASSGMLCGVLGVKSGENGAINADLTLRGTLGG